MNAIVLCFLLGLVLLGFEVFLPGGILGVIGGVFLLIGCGLAFWKFGLDGGAIALAVALGLSGLTVYLELVLLPKTGIGRKMFLTAEVSGTSQPRPALPELVGKTGTTLTTLAPTGYVAIDGHSYEAQSQDGLLAKGAAVRVVAMDPFSLKVSKL